EIFVPVLRGSRSHATLSVFHRGRRARPADQGIVRAGARQRVRARARRQPDPSARTVGGARQRPAGAGEARAVRAALPRTGDAGARAADLSPRARAARRARDLSGAGWTGRGGNDLRGGVHVIIPRHTETAERRRDRSDRIVQPAWSLVAAD